MDTGDRLRELNAYYAALKDERSTWEPDWQSLARHFLPRKSRFLEKSTDDTNKGGLRYDVLDGAGVRAVRVASAGMHGGLTSPSRPWFRLSLMDQELANESKVKPWLDEVTRRMRTIFSRSNFYQAVHSVYNELLVFGTNFMFEHPDDRTGVTFNTLTVGEYYLDTGETGRTDVVIREEDLTARMIVERFGYDNCSDQVRRAYNKAATRTNRFKIIHAVIPRAEKDPSSFNHMNMAYASYYWEQGQMKQFLRESGYSMLPGFGSRWDQTGQDVYGRCPAMDCLGDVRMLQSVWATYLKQEHKRADPPMAVPSGLDHVNTLPGGINPVNVSNGAQAVYPIQNVNPDPSGILNIVQDVRTSIREGMYNDLFKMLALAPTTNMTATEVAERHEEKLLQLGPVLERLHAELFTPLIDRTFYIMVERDMVPPWPEELDNMPLTVDFVSLLAQAQKQVATNAVDRYMGAITAYGQLIPEFMDAIDPDEVADGYADYLGLEVKMLRSKKDRIAIREQRAQAQQMMALNEQVGVGAQTAKSMSETATRGGESSALDDLLNGAAR